MDDREKFNEISLPRKETFYIHLKMEDIIDADYALTKRGCKEFEIRNVGYYHNLYVQSKTLWSADVFENFRNMCFKIYELDLTHFFSTLGLTWQTVLKKIKIKLIFLTDIDILLMIKKVTRDGICHAFYRYKEANNKGMKNYDENKEPSYFKYWDVNNLYELAM